MSHVGPRLFVLLFIHLGLADRAVAVPIEDVVPEVMPGDVELAVIPRPKRERPGHELIAVERPVIVAPRWDDLRAGRGQLLDLLRVSRDAATVHRDVNPEVPGDGTLILIGSRDQLPMIDRHLVGSTITPGDLDDVPNRQQAYVLCVRRGADRDVIVITSPAAQGAFYAIQTLRQLTFVKNGTVYVRQTEIADWPTFAARGTKRTSGTWEYALKSNFHYETGGNRALARDHFADWWVASYLPYDEGVLDASPAGVRRAIKSMTQAFGQGARDFNVHVDDQAMRMDPATDALFDGNYHAALVHLLREVHGAMKRLNRDATLYFLPQTYWTLAPYKTYAARLRAAGGLPPGTGLILCGPQVTSPALPPGDVADFARAFGATAKCLIYDNHLRDSAFGAIHARPAALSRHVHGISPERGTATTRATRLDWAWNPEAYDGERSLLLACREFAGFENWSSLYELVGSIEGAIPGPDDWPRDATLVRFDHHLERAEQLRERLAALPNEGLDGRLRIDSLPPTHVHNMKGTLDEVAILDRALPGDAIARLMREGVGQVYRTAPATGAGLARANFVAAWTFDETEGRSAADLTGNGNDGAIAGGATRSPGRFGRALRLTGESDCYVSVPHRDRQALDRFTITAWVRLEAANRYASIVSKGRREGGTNYRVVVYMEGEGVPYVEMPPAGGGVAGTTLIGDGRWHHVAATCDGSEVRFYVDGVQQAKGATSGPLVAGDDALVLGAVPYRTQVGRPTGYAGPIVHDIQSTIDLLKRRRDRYHEHGLREAMATPVRRPPIINGRLDEDVWSTAAASGPFVVSGRGTVVPEKQQTTVRCLHDRKNLYLGLRMNTPGPIDPTQQRTALGVPLPAPDVPQTTRDLRGVFALGGWHAIALMLDARHDHQGSFEFHLNPTGQRADGRYDIRGDAEPGGLAWDSGWRSAVTVDDDGWSAEIAIPFADLGIRPRSGHVMGMQIWRVGPGLQNSLWSYMPRWWGVQEVTQFGHLVIR
ncbi:MAG: hypothetical protein CMJ18_02985 [Phycisphaeraceae bacterium]|nr:hypothetical protein [Phycisphaeraceae bacterium]